MKKLSFDNNAKNNLDLTLSNTFVKDFLPYAQSDYVKIYIFCLYQCQIENDDWLNAAIKALSTTKDNIIEAFLYWEEMGIVAVTTGEEPEITFLAIKQRDRIRYSRGKYAEFNKQLKSILKIKDIATLELNEYYTLMEDYNLQPEYLIMIIQYCIDNKTSNDLTINYVRNTLIKWINEGVTEVSDIEKRLSDQTKINKNIIKILKALSIDRAPNKTDNDLFLKWSKDFGFTLSFIVDAIHFAGNIKSTSRLNDTLSDLFEKKIFTKEEADIYFATKNEYSKLAIDINKKLSYYDNNIDNVIEIYIKPWKNKGFSNESLLIIAKYCYLINKKTLSSMNSFIESLYTKGIVLDSQINLYLEKMQTIKDEFSKLCIKNDVNIEITQNVIQNYITWRENWNMSIELIDYAMKLGQGTEAPIRYISTTLNSWFNAGIKDLDSAKKFKYQPIKNNKNGWYAEQIENTADDDYSHLFYKLSDNN